jgi:signal transduction histidine kinase
MGLGLYLSQLLIAAQGGSITVDSAGPGRGSVFSVSLPIARDWNHNPGDIE